MAYTYAFRLYIIFSLIVLQTTFQSSISIYPESYHQGLEFSKILN